MRWTTDRGSGLERRNDCNDMCRTQKPCPVMRACSQSRRKAGKTSTEFEARGEKRTRYLTNHCKGIVLDIEMPATAPEKDSTCTNKRIVRIFCEDRKTIWLASNDAGWTMKYIQHQLGSTGVLVVAGTVPGPGRPPPQSLPFTPPLQLTDEGTSDAGSSVE